MGYRIQGAGCRMQVQGELVMLKVYVELDTPRVAMFGVQHGEGAVMLSYNFIYHYCDILS